MVDERLSIIGAGAAGLGTMDVLQRHGIAFDCFEQSDRVGGHWHTDYESLHLITSRDLSGFAGHPMPSDYPVYPSRDQMRTYLERFADETGVRAHVRFGVAVEEITPLGRAGRDGWRVATSDGEVHDYAGVIVCNGHLRDQNVPEYPGTFTGQQIHSGSYRSVADLAGTRVLTVGADLGRDRLQRPPPRPERARIPRHVHRPADPLGVLPLGGRPRRHPGADRRRRSRA